MEHWRAQTEQLGEHDRDNCATIDSLVAWFGVVSFKVVSRKDMHRQLRNAAPRVIRTRR
jgi:hypothetical protein